ncbi:hypothetical protein ACFLSQ_09490, partial [Bacteroidota bacterium]
LQRFAFILDGISILAFFAPKQLGYFARNCWCTLSEINKHEKIFYYNGVFSNVSCTISGHFKIKQSASNAGCLLYYSITRLLEKKGIETAFFSGIYLEIMKLPVL